MSREWTTSLDPAEPGPSGSDLRVAGGGTVSLSDAQYQHAKASMNIQCPQCRKTIADSYYNCPHCQTKVGAVSKNTSSLPLLVICGDVLRDCFWFMGIF